MLMLAVAPAHAADEAWVVGRWELVYDPDGAQKDWLEFLPNGDVYSIGQDGTRYAGFYIVTADGVKAAFSRDGKDVIAVFRADEQRRSLKIVTSPGGEASVYRKVEEPASAEGR